MCIHELDSVWYISMYMNVNVNYMCIGWWCIRRVIDRGKQWSRSLYPFEWKERSNVIRVLSLYPFMWKGRSNVIRVLSLYPFVWKGRSNSMYGLCLYPFMWKERLNDILCYVCIHSCEGEVKWYTCVMNDVHVWYTCRCMCGSFIKYDDWNIVFVWTFNCLVYVDCPKITEDTSSESRVQILDAR